MAGIPIELSHCAKSFADGTRALQPVDLRIEGGETVVLLGPSGCGKTTLLRVIAGLETPDAGGRVRFAGEDVTEVPIERRRVGMVFQSYALFPNLTVAGNVEYGLKVRRMPAPERAARVSEMLEMMRIGPLAARRVDQLSGGQRQRVALARAIAPRPRVLLLDEPLTALDAKLREELRGEIDRLLRGLGITSVYVTHDQAEAMALGDRVAVMTEGRIAQLGTPHQVYFEPADAFVAEFVGTTNRLRDADGTEWLCRPEALRLVADDGAPVRGRVASRFFLGDHTRLVVHTEDGATVTARVPARASLQVGELVRFDVDRADRMPVRAARD
jgi:putative spermidine/putrescine transport system ATP-binding protein